MGTVIATSAAIDAIMRLRVECRAIALRESGGRVIKAKLPPGINDLQLGQVGGVPFLIDADEYRRWGWPDLVIDVPRWSGQAPVNGTGRFRLVLRSSC